MDNIEEEKEEEEAAAAIKTGTRKKGTNLK